MHLEQFIGDSATHRVALAIAGVAFNPSGHVLTFTAKADAEDADVDSIFQKTTGAGITTEESGGKYYANIAVVPDDTLSARAGTIVCDIQAVNSATGARKTLAFGKMILKRDITRESGASVPIHTTEPISPDSALAAIITAKTAAESAATAAATSATAAATSAAAAATSATAAAGSASAAAASASAAATSATASDASATDSASSAASSLASKTAAETAAATAVAATGNIMVLVGQNDTSATLAAGDNITVEDGSGPYPSSIITFPN